MLVHVLHVCQLFWMNAPETKHYLDVTFPGRAGIVSLKVLRLLLDSRRTLIRRAEEARMQDRRLTGDV